MNIQDLRKWLAVGTGVGIEIGRRDLNITVARVRPAGVRILGSLTIGDFRKEPAAEWGSVYTNFLRKLGGSYLTATVMLPREDVIVRQIALPGVVDRDVSAALNYQIDSLHPYAEEDAAYGWARLRKTPVILVGITRREVLDRYCTLFNEAGVKISAFTFSAAVMYAALRLYAAPHGDGFLAISKPLADTDPSHDDPSRDDPSRDREGAVLETYEIYGESPARPLFSAGLEMPEQRARVLALSELRLAPDAEPVSFDAILPKPLAAPAGEDLSRTSLPYATALAGACPRLSQPVNLLPEKQRAMRSRWLYVPTIALASLLLLVLGALGMSGAYENRRYLAILEQERRRIEPQATQADALEREIAVLRNRAQTLDNFRARSNEDMDALNELTRTLAPPTWLNGLQLTRTQLSITGETDQATPLLKALDGTKQFKRSEFTLPLSRLTSGESFSIRASREGVAP